MHNWDYPKQDNTKRDEKWRLERLLTYGFDNDKINKNALKKHWNELKIPLHTKVFFELLLWNKPF